MKTCSNCGHDLGDQDPPCPECGGENQTVRVELAGEVSASGAIGLTVQYAPNRPWYEQWDLVKRRLARLEELCRAGGWQGNDSVKDAVKDFFEDSLHVADWVGNNPATPQDHSHARNYMASDAALRINVGMGNTTKHHIRSSGMTVRFKDVAMHPDGTTQVLLEWTQGKTSGTEDALDLARRCVVAWEKYFRDNSIPTS